jgi:lipid II:glycine glycyltransferase (peptidoglycan interpeptide bridge formation enzyme)
LSASRPSVTAEQSSWDAAVRSEGGHLLQSWRWGAFKERFGWEVERVTASGDAGPALAQVLFRRRAGLSIGYIPRGPVLTAGDATAIDDLMARIDHVARRRRALVLIIEPDRALPEELVARLHLRPGPAHIQPARTVKIDLGDDETLMAGMHAKSRYNVRLALRRGVTTERAEPTSSAISAFYRLLEETAARNRFVIHASEYYREFFDQFGDDAALLFAEVDGKRVAGATAAAFGDEAIYMYGATSTVDRAHGAAFLLQLEVMRWARERGCRRYDLWGIPEQDPASSRSESGDRLAATSGNDRRGLYEFKTRFGGQIVRYPPTLERRYVPVLATLARRYYDQGA